MADKVIVYWRDIPAQVIVKAGRRTARRQLAERFEQAIDRAAMRAGLTGTDAYLEQWRRADPVPCGDDLEAEADGGRRGALEAEYTPERLRELVAKGGIARARRCTPSASGRSAMPASGSGSTARFERACVAAGPLLRRIGYRAPGERRRPRWSAGSRACCSTAGCAANAC